jgi:peptidoglycan hydrolase CwlO-like protein
LMHADAKRDATNAATELKGTQLKIKHINEELKEKKKLAQHEGKEYTKLKSEHEALTKEMDALKVSSVMCVC